MKATVIGTSNGIISDGYIKAFRDSGLYTSIKNLSVGASSCCFLPYRTNEIDWNEVDVIFVESMVNDAASIRANAFDSSHIKSYYYDLINKCSLNKVLLVGLLLPGRTNDKHTDEVSDILVEIFDSFHIPFLDFGQALTVYSKVIKTDVFDLYRDAAHLKSEVIYHLCSEMLKENLSYALPKLTDKALDEFQYINLKDLSFAKSESIEIKHITNSLLTIETTVFGGAIDFTINFPFSAFWIYGLVLNSNNTHGQLTIKGQNSNIKNLCFELLASNDKIIVTPLKEVVFVEDHSVCLSLEKFSKENEKVGEKAYQGKIINYDLSCLEIAGFIVKRIG